VNLQPLRLGKIEARTSIPPRRRFAVEHESKRMSPFLVKLLIAGYILGQGSFIMGICARYKIFGGARVVLSVVFLLHLLCAAIIVIFA